LLAQGNSGNGRDVFGDLIVSDKELTAVLASALEAKRRLRPDPRHVLITGASSGLGAALARAYASRGAALSLFGRDEERLGTVAIQCRAGGARADVYLCDVRSGAEAARQLVEADARDPVDLVIANAGVGGAGAMAGAAGESLEQARAIIETNFLGVVHTVGPLLPAMMSRGRGQIALVGSLAGLLGLPHSPVYSATKSAVHLYGEGLQRLLRGSGVSVTVICPGFVDTPMAASLTTPKPFLWTADRAAAKIAWAIARRRRTLIFPWQLRLAATAGRLLPAALVDLVLSSASGVQS
jgi:short-subunit dehydrogenase